MNKNKINEADVSIDTDLAKNDKTAAEEKLLDLISISRSFDNLEGIQLATTNNGNIRVTYNDQDVATINGKMFSEEEIDDLRTNGYYDDFNKTSIDESEKLEAEERTFTPEQEAAIERLMKMSGLGREEVITLADEFKKMTTSTEHQDELEAEDNSLKSHPITKHNAEALEKYNKEKKELEDLYYNEEISKKEYNGRLEQLKNGYEDSLEENEKLSEQVVPASNLDFKHQQLAQVQDMIKVIAELKAEDNSNTLYTELLDGYDKLIKILTDAIVEDPVGTVVGDGFNTGLESQPQTEENPDEEELA